MFTGSQRKRRQVIEREFVPHMNALFRYALSMTHDRDRAEELTQDTLAKAIEHADKYKPDTNARAWLFRIMTNHYINQRRARRPEVQFLEGVEPHWDAHSQELLVRSHLDPERSLVTRLAGSQIKEALERLPEDFRMVVVLADLEGFSYREIADQVGCPIGTVMSRLHRGRRIMRQHLLELGKQLGLVHDAPAVEDAADADVDHVLESLDRFRTARDIAAGDQGQGG
ncbi:MAG: sigma-70 family RNA polymerase sigma factor [Pseudomonadota bacterium]